MEIQIPGRTRMTSMGHSRLLLDEEVVRRQRDGLRDRVRPERIWTRSRARPRQEAARRRRLCEAARRAKAKAKPAPVGASSQMDVKSYASRESRGTNASACSTSSSIRTTSLRTGPSRSPKYATSLLCSTRRFQMLMWADLSYLVGAEHADSLSSSGRSSRCSSTHPARATRQSTLTPSPGSWLMSRLCKATCAGCIRCTVVQAASARTFCATTC